MKSKTINFLEMYKGMLYLLDNVNSTAVYNIDVKKYGDALVIKIINSPYFYELNDTSMGFEIADNFTEEEMRLVVNTIRNMFIEERKIHKPFIDFKHGEQVIENSKFHLITHFNKDNELELNDAMYFHETAVQKYEMDNFELIKK